MTALQDLLAANARQSSSRFFLRCGQAGRAARPRDEMTRPLFPLTSFLPASNSSEEYLRRCEALIREAAREIAA